MTDYTNADPGNSTTWPHCDDCGCRHSSPLSCRYPRLRALCREITPEQDRFLHWLAGWDDFTTENFESIIMQAKREAQ